MVFVVQIQVTSRGNANNVFLQLGGDRLSVVRARGEQLQCECFRVVVSGEKHVKDREKKPSSNVT